MTWTDVWTLLVVGIPVLAFWILVVIGGSKLSRAMRR